MTFDRNGDFNWGTALLPWEVQDWLDIMDDYLDEHDPVAREEEVMTDLVPCWDDNPF